MTPASLNPKIVEKLYEEALLLAEEARAAFELDGSLGAVSEGASAARIAMSCEALRTTTRMMHAIAWLLNQRAFFEGEMSEFQLRRHGRLPSAQPRPDREQLALLPPYVASVVNRSAQFYARAERIDGAWRCSFEMQPAAVHRLRERLGYAFAS